ncbi:MAG: matrixin family metalloprotease [Pyrinomonadaceae bacterium]
MRPTATLSTALLILAALVLSPVAPARAYTLQYANASATQQLRWPSTTITVALSTSLNNPPSYVHATAAQVLLAARRALSRWSLASNIQFNVTTSTNQTVAQDGVSLITIAPENASQFAIPEQPSRARVFFDSNGIFEADLAINPNVARRDPVSGSLVASFFSTDGTDGSYDLESTFVHEIGHMLGLEHSGIVGASMQPRQGTNGTYNLPNFTTRTLSSDDVAGVRAIYGPRHGLGSIAGRVGYNSTSGVAAFGAHVFVEETATGRTIASNVALSDGRYRIDGLAPAQYRVVVEYLDEPVLAREIAANAGGYTGLVQAGQPQFLTTEAGLVNVSSDSTTPLDVAVQSGSVAINPTFIGLGPVSTGMLSSVAVPLVPGQPETILVGGDNLGVVNSVTVNSPFLTVSNVQQVAGFGIPVLSFDLNPSELTPPGEYSVRLQTSTGQVAYVSGGLTVDLPVGVTAGQNLADDSDFFVAQHYRDFLSREPDTAGLAFWTHEIEQCGTDAQCRDVKRVNVSAAFFLSIEFQETGYLVYRFYKAAFGNLPNRPVPVRMQQFFPDTQEIGRGIIVGQGNWRSQLETNKQAFALEFVQREEFVARYPTTLGPAQFVDALFANAGVTPTAAERQAAIDEFGTASNTTDLNARARALRRVAENATLQQQEFNRAFVLMEYFGYLRRNPDDAPDSDFTGYNFWLAKLNQFNGNFVAAEMVKAFISSPEYRQRFGS